jgi:hypothetical protein
MQFPIKWQKGIQGTSFAGFDTFSTSASDTRVNLLFVPKFYETNVVLPLDEMSANQTDERVLDLAKLDRDNRALRDQFAISNPKPSSYLFFLESA